MKITITVPKESVKVVEGLAQEILGRKPTKAQLEKFFVADIEGIYSDIFDDGIEDSVEGFFG